MISNDMLGLSSITTTNKLALPHKNTDKNYGSRTRRQWRPPPTPCSPSPGSVATVLTPTRAPSRDHALRMRLCWELCDPCGGNWSLCKILHRIYYEKWRCTDSAPKKGKKCINVGTIQKTIFTTFAILATYLQESMLWAIASAKNSTTVSPKTLLRAQVPFFWV